MKNQSTHLIGNALVGQSGGPTAAINATLSGVIRGVAAARETIPTLYGMRYGIEGFLEGDVIDLSKYFDDESSLSLLEQTPAAALGSCRKKLPDPSKDPAFFEKLVKRFEELDIRYFFYIGGNDSMDTVAKLTAYLETVSYEMRVIGVPKTIDNDLVGTDHTPGFGSAAKYIAVTVSEYLRDCAVYRVPAVTIIEIMGRDAGWLTASAALPMAIDGIGPDYIYLPERVFDREQFLSDVRAALSRHPNVVIAISEGIRFADGEYVGAGSQSGAKDVFGHKYLAGAGKVLESIVREEIGCKVRSAELSLSQRCAAHLASETDLDESVRIGMSAVSFAVGGISGHMVTACRTSSEPYVLEIGSSDVLQIANQIRAVPSEFINEDGNHVTDACIKFLLPLINGERKIVYDRGIPKHFHF
jgi:6-phosphofructokinase 1